MSMRPISEADYPAIQALHRQVGWPERSLAGWRWLHDNPARVETGAVAGWVTEGPDGRPAAHVGNMVQRFVLGDRVLFGATGFSIIVSRSVRGASRGMMKAFVEQPGMFAAYAFNTNRLSGPLYPRQGMYPFPSATHAMKLGWVVDPVPLAIARALRALVRHAPWTADHLGERLMNRKLGPAPKLDLPPGVAVLTDFRDRSRYAEFWDTLRAEGRLLADRSPAAIRWRLADPDLTVPPVILAFNRGRDLTGYAMAMLCKANIIEAPVLEIIDLEAHAGEADAIPALMQGLMTAARAMGAAKLRLQSVSPLLLDRLGPWRDRARDEGGWGHAHARFAPNAPDPALWSPTPYDGDYAMCLRPAPTVRVTAGAGAQGRRFSSSRISASRASVGVGAAGAGSGSAAF